MISGEPGHCCVQNIWGKSFGLVGGRLSNVDMMASCNNPSHALKEGMFQEAIGLCMEGIELIPHIYAEPPTVESQVFDTLEKSMPCPGTKSQPLP